MVQKYKKAEEISGAQRQVLRGQGRARLPVCYFEDRLASYILPHVNLEIHPPVPPLPPASIKSSVIVHNFHRMQTRGVGLLLCAASACFCTPGCEFWAGGAAFSCWQEAAG